MIKVSEIFGGDSVMQGEGFHIGTPSVFLRVFGCNFRCRSYGINPVITSGTNPEVAEIIKCKDQYQKYSDFPVINTGCDTYLSIYPEFKEFSPMMTIESIVDYMETILKDKTFGKDQHLVITGGEPLLGFQREYPKLIEEIYRRNLNLTDLTFETNGTQPLSSELINGLNQYRDRLRVTFSVSPKLPCSGESWDAAIKPTTVVNYNQVENSFSYLKFVVSDQTDLSYANLAVEEFRSVGFTGSVYLMPIGGTMTTYHLNERQVADLAIANGYRFSPRLQVQLYKNEWGK